MNNEDTKINMSEEIRRLFNKGKEVKEIYKELGISYQFAYNVIDIYKKQMVLLNGSIESDGADPEKQKGRIKTVGTGMFSRMNYSVIRGMKEIYAIRDLSLIEWEVIKSFFGNRCAYCHEEVTGDSRNGLVADHLIAAVDDGDFVIGNVVAACHDCNDSRGKKKWEAWLRAAFPDHAESRIQKVKEYLVQYSYVPSPGAMGRLLEKEYIEYEAIMTAWGELLQRARILKAQVDIRRR